MRVGYQFRVRRLRGRTLSIWGISYMPTSNPRTRLVIDISSASQIRRRVVTVMGRPASICCQCRAENPNEIMSSCE